MIENECVIILKRQEDEIKRKSEESTNAAQVVLNNHMLTESLA